VLAACGVFAGMCLLFVSCFISLRWWPMLVLLPYAMLPIPPFMCTTQQDYSAQPGENVMQNLGNFLVGILISSTFALHIMLQHLDIIDGLATFLAELANVVLYGTVIVYIVWSRRQAGF
jgi:hypothetical protein